MTPDEKLNMTPYEKLNMVLDIFKKTAYYEMESIEQKDIVNKLSDLLSDVIEQKVNVNDDVLSSDIQNYDYKWKEL